MGRRRMLLLVTLVLLAVPSYRASAGFGDAMIPGGQFHIGVSMQRFTHDLHGQDNRLQPSIDFGFSACEARFGIWRSVLELGTCVGMERPPFDQSSGRDYMRCTLGDSTDTKKLLIPW